MPDPSEPHFKNYLSYALPASISELHIDEDTNTMEKEQEHSNFYFFSTPAISSRASFDSSPPSYSTNTFSDSSTGYSSYSSLSSSSSSSSNLEGNVSNKSDVETSSRPPCRTCANGECMIQ